MVKLPPAQLSYHELAKLTDMAVISHAQTPIRDGLSVPEQYMEKLNYSIEFIRTKQYALQDHMHQQHAEKLRLMADVGKSMDRDIVRLDYKTKGKKKRVGTFFLLASRLRNGGHSMSLILMKLCLIYGMCMPPIK